MSKVWYLKGLAGQYEGQEITLPGEVLWLGRAVSGTPNTDTHLFFEDGAVSRVHGALAWAENFAAYVIHHRSQTNPTFLNGESLTEPKLLKPGDIVSFGHQRLEVAERSDAPTPSAAPHTRAGTGVSIRAKTKSGATVLNAGKEVVIELDPGFGQTSQPVMEGETTFLKLAARKAAKLTITAGTASGSYKVQLDCPELIQTHRVTSTDYLILDVPFAAGSSLEFGPGDLVLHQGVELSSWSGEEADPDNSTSSSTVSLEMKAFKKPVAENKDRGLVEFQTGEWKGASIMLGPEYEQGVEIGPNCSIAGFPVPIKDGPTCRISYIDGAPHIEVVEAVDGHYVSVNGELLFATQANPLVSGSGIFLGKSMLFWTQPAIQKRLSDLKLMVGETALPIPRGLTRIGTAAQCEVLLDDNGLAPVSGTLECTHEGLFYKHLDGSVPAQLDGETLISGDRVEFKEGSSLQVGLDTTIILKAK